MLLSAIANNSENLIIDQEGIGLTKNQICEIIDELSHYLTKGITVNFCSNTIGSTLGYIACLELGIPIIMIDNKQDISLIYSLLFVYKPTYLWLPENAAVNIGIKGDLLYTKLGYSLVRINKEFGGYHKELVLLLPTSGSTGSPKLVKLSKQNVLSNAKNIADYLKISSSERAITTLPIHYSYGLSIINSHLIKGASIIFTEFSVLQKEFWQLVKQYEITSISGVPYTYEMLRRLKVFQMDLPYLRTFTQAGGKLNADIVKEFIINAIQHKKEFIVMYGQTEATARMSYLPFLNALEKYQSIGKPIPNGRFSLIDEMGNEITEVGITGELVYYGDNVSMGYAETKNDLITGDENLGKLNTGDLAKVDSDGYYYITGRKNRFVKVHGNRISLDELENIIKGIIPEIVCVGVDDNINVFTTRKDKELEIKNLIVSKTKLHPKSFSIKIIENFPYNTSGKILYNKLLTV
jgi:acyl-coenzyme A synthetase/AMP-(fatty) acid ligase